MNKIEFKERWKKVDDRIKKLIENYPLVFVAVLLAGVIVGGIMGAVLS